MSNPNNSCNYSGFITSEPIFIQTKEGVEFQARFSLSVRRSYKAKDGKHLYDYIPVRINGEKRMNLAHKLHEGNSVRIVGEMRSGSFINKEGDRVFTLYLDMESLTWNSVGRSKAEPSSDVKSAKQPVSETSAAEQENTSYGDMALPFD